MGVAASLNCCCWELLLRRQAAFLAPHSIYRNAPVNLPFWDKLFFLDLQYSS
jgi:hypothetical protein